jgi:hypothetical protein
VFGDESIHPYHLVQKFEKLKLKIKNFKNDQIKKKLKLNLLCLLAFAYYL